MDTFIGIDLKKGKHKIVMKFYPKGLILGIIISLFSIVLTFLYNVSLHKNIQNIKK